MTPRTVVIPGNGTNALSFTVPANVDFNVESVVASVNAAGAGDTIGELSIAEVTGEVIATKRQGLPIPGGSSGTETWALRLDDESAGTAAAAGLSWATIWGDQMVPVYGGGSPVYTQIRTDGAGAGFEPGFATNDAATFSQDTYDGISHWNGLLINAPGVYLTTAGATVYEHQNPAEPIATVLFAGWDSFYYTGSDFTFSSIVSQQTRTAMTNTQFGNLWSPYDTDYLYLETDATFPHQYTVSVQNLGTQTLRFHGSLFTLRVSDSLSSSAFPYYDGL